MFCVHAQPPIVSLSTHRTEASCSYTSSSPRQTFKRACRYESNASLKRCSKMLPNRTLNPRKWGQARAAQDSAGVSQQTDPNNTRKEVFEAAADRIVAEYADEQGLAPGASITANGSSSTGSEIAEGSDRNGTASTESKTEGSSSGNKSTEQEVDWENVPTLPDELDIAQRHPLDPHKPNFSELLPEPLRPYPSFEGWFIRVWDPTHNFSAAVIMATNYATDESQVTLLFAPGTDSQTGAPKPDGDRASITHGYTYAVAVKTKDAKFKTKEHGEAWDEAERGTEPEGFEWEAKGIGRIVVTPHTTDLDFTVEGYTFKAHLTKELLWDAHNSEKGPEGWARYVAIVPTHWYVYSLGSAAEYSFSNPEKGIRSEGAAYGHVEKNWGQTFPAGHVWLQAFSADNTAQVCCAGAYFKTPNEKLRTPHIFVLGYRSPKLQLDFRTNDLGIVFKDIHFAPLESRFSITAVGPSHTVEVTAYAPYDTFSDTILAPVTKVDWKPACRESFVATAEIKVYEHLAWGIPGTEKLVETQTFEFAGLEFGEDLLTEASQSTDKEE